MRHYLALVACLAFTGSIAHAAPDRQAARHGKKAKKKVKAPPVELDASDEERDDDEDDDNDTTVADDDEESEAPRRMKRPKHKRARAVAREEAESDSHRVAFRDNDEVRVVDEDEDEIDDDRAEAPVKLRETAKKAPPKQWHVAIGPYLWASAVDANVSLGPASVSSGVDFFEITRHARYGAEVLAEARYGRFSIYGDLMYGIVDLGGAKEVGPLMVTLEGSASSLLIDGTAGYMITGGGQSLLSLEARTGVRYQRTAISGSVNVAGNEVSPTKHVDAAADMLAGAHVIVRPFRRFALSGTVDLGVVGVSASTWSASADASVRVAKHVLLSLGWRTLTTERTNVSIVMHGPRAAVQLMF